MRDKHREVIDGYIQKRKAHFDAGRVGIIVDSVFGRRLGVGVISEVLLADGSEAVGSEEVTRTLHDHFKKQFEAQGASWHEEPDWTRP